MMRTSPRRPLILKRRKLPLPDGNASNTPARDEPDGQGKGAPKQEHSKGDKPRDRVEWDTQKFPTGIKIINHPTMPNTQVVIIPPKADIQSIIEALTAKGKECGSNGPNKFILISSGGASRPSDPAATPQQLQSEDETSTATNGAGAADCQDEQKNMGQNPGTVGRAALWPPQVNSVGGQEPEGNSSGEATSSGLDNSLTNIQWLGKMSSDGLGPCTVKQEMEKENQTPVQETVKTEEDSIAATATSSSSWQDSISERPPYSYMAMIQFAINSTEKKRMTLKDIYTWIEDHFPYFKHVAKPGWKNSIRHNLSLHDMFVRETSANGKISFWTIHPDANRYLTLDQVFKPLDAGSPTSPECSESQQKRHIPELQKNTGGNNSNKTEPQNARRKMKPLLPRVNSYLVPIQFPVSQSLVLQSSLKMPHPMAQGASLSSSETIRSSKRVRIAPKVLPSTEEPALLPTGPVKEESHCEEGPSPFAPTQSIKNSQPGETPASFPAALCIKEENEDSYPDKWLPPFPTALSIKEEAVQSDEEPGLFLPVPCVKRKTHFTVLKSPPRGVSDTVIIKRREMGRSRRKQHLMRPCSEEPVLVLPESSDSDSFRLMSDLPSLQETQSLENMLQLSCSQEEDGPFKTPVKEMYCRLPVSSTPSKVPTATPPLGGPDPWRLAPITKESSVLDFSPVRTPQVPFTSLQENLDLLGFNSTPLKNPLFDSPRQLLQTESNDMVSGPLTSSPASNPESTKQSSPEQEGQRLSENQSLMEGLVLDTMNNSLSKILLDISFSGLEDDILGTDMNWSQFIPDLR